MADKSEGEKALSIRDVARIAGVSRQTVSRVLKRQPNVKASTEAHVRQVIEELGWRPNSAARALATSKSKTIGLLVSSRSQYGPLSAAGAVDDAARQRGDTISSATLAQGDDESISAALDAFSAQGVDGVVVIAPQQRAHEALRRVAVGVPFVSLQWRAGPNERVVAFDQGAGARAATRHLIELGHSRILHIAGPQDWNEAEERMRGFLAEMSAADVPTEAPVLGDWTVDLAYELGMKLLGHREFTAVFAELGLRAIDILLADIEGTPPPEPAVVKVPELIVRASTAPPPVR